MIRSLFRRLFPYCALRKTEAQLQLWRALATRRAMQHAKACIELRELQRIVRNDMLD